MGAVLFDIGSTLVDGPELSPVSVITKLLGLPDSKKHLIADIILCNSFRNANEMLDFLRDSFVRDGACIEELINLWKDQEEAPQEIPGATLAVRHVKSSGFKVGLVSDIWAPYYKGFVSACPELAAMVDFAGLSYREGIRKPSRRLLKRVLNALNERPENCWMVGDTYDNDLAPAIEMGIKTIWVLSRPEKEYRAMESVLKGSLPRPDIIVDTIADLVNLNWEKM